MDRLLRGRSVRARLLIIALIPMLILMPLVIGITMQRWLLRTDQILATRVASDLTVAQQYLAYLVDGTGRDLAGLAGSAALRDQDPAGLEGFLATQRARLGLDYLLVLNAGSGPGLPHGSGIAVLDQPTLSALDPGLAARARISPPASDPETRGMVIHATRPVTLPDGRAATLAGGILLNNNTAVIDRINELVYPAPGPDMARRVAKGFDRGITTLFLDDLRISTTLRPRDGARAIGTRASPEVRAHVLGRGESWHDTALVVGEWYISAYEAVTDMNGAQVGMLYTGIPKAPYSAARRITWAITGGAFLIAALLSLPLFLRWARGIFGPIEAMTRTISRVEAGDLDARTLAASDPASGADEIMRLARHLDRLLGLIQQREHDLRALNAGLNLRVAERTAELTRANRALESATRQLLLSEKLATIGEVTAGVAHELNNPLAVIQGNIEVLRLVIEECGGEAATELALIDEQFRRIAALVNQLLQFARPEEFAGEDDLTDPAQIATELPALIRHMLAGIELTINATSTRRIRMNRHELQQVLVNLATNAIQAMPEGGRIWLDCADADHADGRPGIRLSLRDSGPGMDEATMTRIFDPFFTTRGTRGTGLGLVICQTLTARQGGELQAQSSPGAGATFTVWLPAT